ncbi:hypothetical protein HK097_009259 [Rhizophlyctis rosea]|uniref:Alpha-ketoglutarate-dependent dioxygenase AlkB-like domain-containing protein n=1 Tax=Rhizophlyctis rosea TaxID=64517 RepID=A0AAD5X8W8_9FUNG|nr:hypothetical protein HK097_009259 [Rhizophlyctis rosea]
MFTTFTLDYGSDSFAHLSSGIAFENHSETRQGAICVAFNPNGAIPIIRTTTSYTQPSQPFTPALHDLVSRIQTASNSPTLTVNNAMVEIYQPGYTKMGFHTDQALDLEADSFICLFSCYEDPEEKHPRKLVVKEKLTNKEFEIPLTQNSCVRWSTLTNAQHLHKIISGPKDKTQSRWLGITLRLSKTFVNIRAGEWHFQDGRHLRVATDEERKEFMQYKSLENKNIEYAYPEISYTLSRH